MKRVLYAACGIVLASSAGAIQAADEALPTFKELDADADGLVTVEEVKENEQLTKMFEQIDADQSGSLSIEEYEKLLPKKEM